MANLPEEESQQQACVSEQVEGERVSVTRESGSKARTIDAGIRRPSCAAFSERVTRSSRAMLFLSSMGSMGIGNVWRFPFVAYHNGGGAFLIVYLVLLILVGVPIYFLELLVGQFIGVDLFKVWNSCPAAKGLGYAVIAVSLILCIYIGVIMSYTLFYLNESFQMDIPWGKCDPTWANLTTCYVRGVSPIFNLSIDNNVQFVNVTKQTSTVQFWEKNFSNLSKKNENSRSIKMDLILLLLVSWIITVWCLAKRIKTSGKVANFVVIFPYVILFTLLVVGLLQDGAWNGISYFIYPSWEKVFDIRVWEAAIGQMFFSLGIAMGSVVTKSSYNNFRNNLYRDVGLVSVMDTVTSFISGIATFSILGTMAHDLNVPVSEIVKEGPGLVFIAYSEAVLRLPFPHFWSIMLYLMLFILALDNQFDLLENILPSLSAEFPIIKQHKLTSCTVIATICYIVGVFCVTSDDGNYILTLMDFYGNGVAVEIIALVEIIVFMELYGLKNVCRDVKFMLGFQPSWYWRVTWRLCAPLILGVIVVYCFIAPIPLNAKSYGYPDWVDSIGWVLTIISLVPIPFYSILIILKKESTTFRGKLKEAIKPSAEWGPADPRNKENWSVLVDPQQHCEGNADTSPEEETPV